MTGQCSFCENEAKYYTVSKENQMVARCETHADTKTPTCQLCDREAVFAIRRPLSGPAYYCADHRYGERA